MGFVSQDIISQILERADIVQIISSYIPLKAAGRNFKANCPFHHEKTPSFVVNPDKQIFHCFGCGVGGNALTFLMKQERMDFPEALKFLAEKTGVTIPEQEQKSSKTTEIRQQIIQVNELAMKYYHRNLLSDKSELAKTSRDYLKHRGLTLDWVEKFQLGLALETWDGLSSTLQSQNFTQGFLEKAGLVMTQSRGSGCYDRFRQRIMFPIFDGRGQVVAFGGRTLEKENPAKYINSPETPLYIKGHYVYGLNWAKEAIARQDTVIVVEGYMDFITPFAAGVEHIVASLGTALTVDQVRLLRRYTKNIIMLYDADPAGQTAMIRSLDLLVEEGMSVKVAALSEGEDPDSFIRKYGKDAFLKAISEADSLFDFKLKFLLKRFPAGTIESNAKIAGEMLSTLAKFDNAILQSEYLKKLSIALKVSQEALKLEMSKGKPLPVSSPAPRTVQKREEQIRPAERSLLQLMLLEKDFISISHQELQVADFQNVHVRDIVSKIFELSAQGHEAITPTLMSCFDNQEVLDIITGIVASDESFTGDKHKMYRDCARRLRDESRKGRRQELLRQMELARNKGDHKALEHLTHAFNQLIKG